MIPFDEMWMRLKKLVKPNGAIVLFGSEPFSSALRMSNIKDYKYDWYWRKPKGTGHLNAYKMPLKNTENISVFMRKVLYNPQFKKGSSYKEKSGKSQCALYGKDLRTGNANAGVRFPVNGFDFPVIERGTLHPTQKPVALMEYLIKTYTLPGETVLDFTMGSGSTGVAAKKLGRKFIGIELDTDYFEIAKNRINEVWAPGQTEPSDKKPIAEKEQLDIWDALAS